MITVNVYLTITLTQTVENVNHVRNKQTVQNAKEMFFDLIITYLYIIKNS